MISIKLQSNCEFCEIFKNMYFNGTPLVAASELKVRKEGGNKYWSKRPAKWLTYRVFDK